MSKQEFISVAKRMVTEYINVFINKGKISVGDVCVIGFHDTPDHYRILLSVPASDEFYYEVVYDKNTTGIHSYAYKKVGKRVIGKRFNNK